VQYPTLEGESHLKDYSKPKNASTQCGRVLNALRKTGQYGITGADFLLPNVVDGGKPIIRSQTRIFELKREGYRIINTKKVF
jgi:hypothetical protein